MRDPELERLTTLLDVRPLLPADVVASLMALVVDDNDTLSLALHAWDTADDHADNAWRYAVEFHETVTLVTSDYVTTCNDCDACVWQDTTLMANDGDNTVCESCYNERYRRCVHCDGAFSPRRLHEVSGEYYCRDCRDNYCFWCEHCEEYFGEDDDHDFAHEDDEDNSICDCEAINQRFVFPADGHGTIAQDERLTVELPAGTIDDVGMRAIENLLERSIGSGFSYKLPATDDLYPTTVYGFKRLLETVTPQWQTKRGNFTKRLAAALYAANKTKLPPEVVSEIGNLARAHSSNAASWHIEVTRDLNQSASYFVHGGSCWFTGGDYGCSRCALKSWGGLGLRSFDSADTSTYRPSGRAWVLPLRYTPSGTTATLQCPCGDSSCDRATLRASAPQWTPTHDTLTADAFLVFNGYGTLDGYTPTRIVAHLTGKSYRKLAVGIDAMYVNGDTGYLVADAALCEATEHIWTDLDYHDTTDAHAVRAAERVSA